MKLYHCPSQVKSKLCTFTLKCMQIINNDILNVTVVVFSFVVQLQLMSLTD